jgi:cation:H+ antiporter
MLLAVLLVLIGFVLLVKGADLFVDGASHLAYALGVTPLFVGLTVVSFGTSAPELAINLMAAFQGNADIAVGNVVGSNIANMGLIVGVSAILHPVRVASAVIVREIPFLFLTSLALWFLADDLRFQPDRPAALLSRGDGLILLLFFTIFMYYLFASARHGRLQEASLAQDVVDVEELKQPRGPARAVGTALVGLAAVILGGHWVVEGSVTIARALGWSQALIGVTIVAVGTSLPELATSVVAARRGAADLAIGNVVGSCIFNNVAILGLTALAAPLRADPRLMIDVQVMLAVGVLLFLFTLRHRTIERSEGIVLAIAYAAYLAYVGSRG